MGLLVAWAAGVLTVKTANGTIVLEDVPADAVVEIDGDRVQVTPKEGEPIKFEATAGKHGLVVRRGDLVLLVESVTLEAGKNVKLQAHCPASTSRRSAARKIDLPRDQADGRR